MKSNISVDYLKKIATKSGCDRQFSLDTVQKIAKALEIDAKDLFNNQIKHRKKYVSIKLKHTFSFHLMTE